jgi:hypothetical protein
MPYPVGSPYSGATPNPAYAGIFIPTLWSGKLLEKFYNATVLAAISNTDYEGEIKNQGDTVKIRTRPTITIDDYQADQVLTVRRPSSNLIDLSIDKGKYFNLALDDVMEIQSDLDQLSIWAEDAAEQMKIAVDTDVLTYLGTTADINTLNRGNTAGAISANIRLGTPGAPVFINKAAAGTGDGTSNANDMHVTDFIVNAGQVLDEQNIPETGRWMVIPAWMASLIKKSDLKDASITGDGTSILRNGRLGMVDRFTIYISNLLPSSGGGYTEEKAVFFGTNAALTFASQFTKMETMRSEQSFATLVRGLQVYGYRVVNGVAMGRAFVEQG